VRQGEGDKRAMHDCIDVLRAGHALMIFPEGSRTYDGKTQRFNPGTMLLIKRGLPRVVPVAIEGAFDVWPRGRAPRPTGRMFVQYGRPIDAQTLIDMGRDQALGYLSDRVETMRQELAQRLARSDL
jgi:1-acyl-sn-glycerol-3-phosphate acyltransferase